VAENDVNPGGTPRWVKLLGIVGLVVLVLVVVLLVTGRGGSHGPGRHASTPHDAAGHSGPPPGATHPYA
jgi:hypothetical protein